METVGGCPICQRQVSGNSELGYLCGNCHLVFARTHLRQPSRRREQMESFSEFLRSPDASIYHVPECKYARRIESPIPVAPQERAGLRACRCVKRNN